MNDSFHKFWLVFPFLLLTAISAGIFLRSHLQRRRSQYAARRQFFYRACRKAGITGSEDLRSAERYHAAAQLAQEYALPCSCRDTLGRILDEERPFYEARRRKTSS